MLELLLAIVLLAGIGAASASWGAESRPGFDGALGTTRDVG